jgi:hypothetical protein
VITRDNVPVAAFIPMAEMDKLDPQTQGTGKDDPLLDLCGNFDNDAFVDTMSGLDQTGLYLREQQLPISTRRYGGAPVAQVVEPLPPPEVPSRTGSTLRPPALVHPPAYVESSVPAVTKPHMAKPPPKRGK